jgi:hypothetical protein
VNDTHLAIKRVLAMHQRRRMQRLVVFASGVFVFMLLAWFFTNDGPAPTDSDLIPPPATSDARPPRAPDLLKLTLAAATGVDSKEVAGRPAWTWDTPLLSRTVGANAVALDDLRDLVSQTDWSPNHPTWGLEDLGSNANWDELRQAKAASIAYFARLNDDEAAMQSALELATLARRMQSVTAWPTFYARGIELHQLACECMAEVVRSSHLTSRKLALYQAEFENAAPSDAQLREVLGHFYNFERHIVLDPAARAQARSGKAVPRLFFKPNQTLDLFAKAFRGLRGEVTKTPYARIDPVTTLIGAQGSPLTTLLNPNRSGITHANQRIWPYALLVDRQGLQSARHLLVLTAFAIRRYALDHGSLPQTLSDLLPNYFNDLPKDPFNGEPLHYDAARGLLYSVGQDYRDSGGHVGTTPLSDSYEPTLSVK